MGPVPRKLLQSTSLILRPPTSAVLGQPTQIPRGNFGSPSTGRVYNMNPPQRMQLGAPQVKPDIRPTGKKPVSRPAGNSPYNSTGVKPTPEAKLPDPKYVNDRSQGGSKRVSGARRLKNNVRSKLAGVGGRAANVGKSIAGGKIGTAGKGLGYFSLGSGLLSGVGQALGEYVGDPNRTALGAAVGGSETALNTIGNGLTFGMYPNLGSDYIQGTANLHGASPNQPNWKPIEEANQSSIANAATAMATNPQSGNPTGKTKAAKPTNQPVKLGQPVLRNYGDETYQFSRGPNGNLSITNFGFEGAKPAEQLNPQQEEIARLDRVAMIADNRGQHGEADRYRKIAQELLARQTPQDQDWKAIIGETQGAPDSLGNPTYQKNMVGKMDSKTGNYVSMNNGASQQRNAGQNNAAQIPIGTLMVSQKDGKTYMRQADGYYLVER